MSGACPLLKQSADLARIELHNVLPKVHRVVTAVPCGLGGVINMPTREEVEAVGASAVSTAIQLEKHKPLIMMEVDGYMQWYLPGQSWHHPCTGCHERLLRCWHEDRFS
jgi:hypothetical protein